MVIHRTLLIATCAVAALTVMLRHAVADDFAPPAWRDLAYQYSTLQGWDFLTNDNPLEADDLNVALFNGDGDGGALPKATMSPGLLWNNADGDGGWVRLGADPETIFLRVPNWIDQLPLKRIRIQITYFGTGGAPPIIPSIVASDSVAGPVFGVPSAPPTTMPLEQQDQWGVFQDFTIEPNPDWEEIQINVPANTLIDQIVVDTISIPEPASVALLVVGGLAMITRRR